MELLDEIQKIVDIWNRETPEPFTDIKWSNEDFNELTTSPLFQSIFSEKVLSRKFRSLLKPFIGLKYGKQVFCKYNVAPYEEEGQKVYTFSVLTRDLINVNNAFFNAEDNRRSALDFIYKPYLYELSFENIEDKFLHDYKEDTWYEVILHEQNSHEPGHRETEPLEPNQLEPNQYESVQNESGQNKANPLEPDQYESVQHESDQYELDMLKHDGLNKEVKIVMSGRLLFAASPLETKQVVAGWKGPIPADILRDISETQKDDIEAYLKTQPSDKIQQHMDALFNDTDQRYIRVYRVGQANAVSGWNRNGLTNEYSSFLFDVGLPENENLVWESNTNSIKRDECFVYDEAELAVRKPNVIFLSHWHRDHFKGAYIMNRAIFATKDPSIWLAPKFFADGRDYATKLLVGYLMKMKQILFVEDTYQNSQDTVILHRVKPSDTGKTTDLNHDCILLELQSTLLSGDCFYNDWPASICSTGTNGANITNGTTGTNGINISNGTNTNKSVNKNIQNVIVPHHGSKTSITGSTFTKLNNLLSPNRYKAVICVGKNRWGHPDSSVIHLYDTDLNFKSTIKTNEIVKPVTPILIKDM